MRAPASYRRCRCCRLSTSAVPGRETAKAKKKERRKEKKRKESNKKKDAKRPRSVELKRAKGEAMKRERGTKMKIERRADNMQVEVEKMRGEGDGVLSAGAKEWVLLAVWGRVSFVAVCTRGVCKAGACLQKRGRRAARETEGRHGRQVKQERHEGRRASFAPAGWIRWRVLCWPRWRDLFSNFS